MLGELKNMASQAASMSAMQYKERKELLKQEEEEDKKMLESNKQEIELRQAQLAREKEMKSEARGISHKRKLINQDHMDNMDDMSMVRRQLAHQSVPALPPMITGAPIATRGFILGLHIRMGVNK